MIERNSNGRQLVTWPFRKKSKGPCNAYPRIKTVQIIIEEYDGAKGVRVQRHVYDELNLPGECYYCHNPICCNGQIQLGPVVRKMVRDRKTCLRWEQMCPGYEGSPMGRIRYGECPHRFVITISLTYKAATGAP